MNTFAFIEKNRFKLVVALGYTTILFAILLAYALYKCGHVIAQEFSLVGKITISREIAPPQRAKVSPAELENKFEEKIKEKYKNATIFDIGSGIKHIKLKRFVDGKPVKINVIEFNRKVNPNLNIQPRLASSNLGINKRIHNIAGHENIVAAVNGTFFKPDIGIPIGILMINEKIYTGPIYNRVAFGIFDNEYKVSKIKIQGALVGDKNTINIDNINQPRILSTLLLAYTQEWGKTAPRSPEYGMQIAISKTGKIIAASAEPLEIPKGGYVVVGPKKMLNPFMLENQKAKISFLTEPKWEGVRHIISGGPYLVKESEIYVDTKSQRLKSIKGRNPRTAIGYTKEGNVILATVDGREKQSVGMTLYELASFMKSVECENAINLDGGGSTVMYVKGRIENSPAQPAGIRLSNALIVSKT